MSKNRVIMMVIMIGGCVVATSPTWAQMQPQPAQPQQPGVTAESTQLLDKINKVQKRVITLQERINTIAQQAQEKNPELKKMHTDLMDIYKKKLDKYGYPSETEMQQLREMQQRLQASGAEGMDKAKRQQLTQQFNTEVKKLQQAQEKAQGDTEVVAAQQSFEQTRSKAMNEIDPEAQKLQQEFETVQVKLGDLRQQLQQVQQEAPQK